jgi:hypothetical protein
MIEINGWHTTERRIKGKIPNDLSECGRGIVDEDSKIIINFIDPSSIIYHTIDVITNYGNYFILLRCQQGCGLL